MFEFIFYIFGLQRVLFTEESVLYRENKSLYNGTDLRSYSFSFTFGVKK